MIITAVVFEKVAHDGGGVSVVAVGITPPPHRTRTKAEWKVLDTRRTKSTGSAGLIRVKVTTTGLYVPGVNAGMLTVALTGAPTTVIDCEPVPALTWSTVTEPGPLDTPKETIPPGINFPQ